MGYSNVSIKRTVGILSQRFFSFIKIHLPKINSFENSMQKRNIYTFLIILSVIILYSCRSTIVRNEIADGTWMVGDKVYETVNVTIQDTGNTMTAVGLDSRGLVLKFGKLPTTNSDYKIVHNPEADEEVKIIAILQDTTDAYVTTGLDDKSARITFNNGLMTVRIPAVEAEHVHVKGEKVTIQGLLTEK